MTKESTTVFPLGRAILGGLIGSVVMAMWAMMVSAVSGMGIWAPVQLIAAVWFGSSALMHVSSGILLAGLMTHMMTGIVLGIILAGVFKVTGVRTGSSRLLWGVGYGLAVWVISQFVLLPAVDPMMASHMPAWAFALGHMMFGIVAAAFVVNQPKTSKSEAPRSAVAR